MKYDWHGVGSCATMQMVLGWMYKCCVVEEENQGVLMFMVKLIRVG